MKYFDYQTAVVLHDYVLKISGGYSGMKDARQLSSTIEFVQNDDYYPKLEDKICYLVYSVAMNHTFLDGNKRTAIVLGGLLMALNGYSSSIPYYFIFMESLVLNLVENGIKRAKFEEIIKYYLTHGHLSEEYLLLILEQREKSVETSSV